MSTATIIESPETLVLFSYTTPVAYVNKLTGEVFKTSKKHSKTTTKHINQFFSEKVIGNTHSAFNVIEVEQETLDKKFPLSIVKL